MDLTRYEPESLGNKELQKKKKRKKEGFYLKLANNLFSGVNLLNSAKN